MPDPETYANLHSYPADVSVLFCAHNPYLEFTRQATSSPFVPVF